MAFNVTGLRRDAPRIAVAISAFRSDASVIVLLERIIQEQWPVERIIVVDSLGSGQIEAFVHSHDLQGQVRYHGSNTNLGSAGNLKKRIELAAENGAEYVLALNHDAVIDRNIFNELVAWSHLEKLGALYPLRFREGKQVYDLTGVADFSFQLRSSVNPPEGPLVGVCWSSSNGALYSTAPFRIDGLCPDADLWHGWEDYLYGLQMRDHGYHQYIVVAAQTVDNYEYKEARAFGRRVLLADKPSWMLYYSIRNFLVIHLHRQRSAVRGAKAVIWVGLMLIHVLNMRPVRNEPNPLRAYLRGLIDGLLNRGGKWRYPDQG